MTKRAAALPDNPSGHELEEFVAALLQGTGHYVEKNIEDPNVLELDIVATSYAGDETATRLFEVKGTDPRLGDLFKLLGRMTYLHLATGAFVTTIEPRERERTWFEDVCAKSNIRFVVVSDLTVGGDVFKAAGFGETDELTHSVWRYSYWIERRFVSVLRDLAKGTDPPPAAVAALEYYRLVNSGVFLTPDTLEKVRKLYAAYQSHPTLMADLAEEMAVRGGGEIGSGEQYRTDHLRKGSHIELDATMYVEHRARLAILKAATDYLRQGGAVRDLGAGKVTIDFGVVSLPQSFLAGLTWLEAQPQYWLYPLYWQNLLWGWGGIIPDEHKVAIENDIATACGLDPANTEAAQQAMDNLFPVDRGWFRTFSSAAYRFVMLTPFPMQGIGAFHQMRRAGHTEHTDYVSAGQYTAMDFIRRQNATVNLLNPPPTPNDAAGG